MIIRMWAYVAIVGAFVLALIGFIDWAGDVREHRLVAESVTEASERAEGALIANTKQDVADITEGAEEARKEQERHEEVDRTELNLERAIAGHPDANDIYLPHDVAECLHQHALAVSRYIGGQGDDQADVPGGCAAREPGFIRSPPGHAPVSVVREAAIIGGSDDFPKMAIDRVRSEHPPLAVVADTSTDSP